MKNQWAYFFFPSSHSKMFFFFKKKKAFGNARVLKDIASAKATSR